MMDTGKAIFFGLALIALAIFAADGFKSASAAQDQTGRYMGSGGSGYIVFITDTVTGRFRRCNTNGGACDPWHKGA